MLTQTLFLLFVLSGFCGLLYQIVWLRLAFKSFGIATPVLSVVVSVFMLGLALGSWGAGRLVAAGSRRSRRSPIYLYAAAELLIGVSALLVPFAFAGGQRWLLLVGEIDSLAYYVYSGLILSATLLPACIAMGATFPLMLAFIRGTEMLAENRFSFLYVANVLGASLGAAITPVILVETFGFRGTLLIAAVINLCIAAISVLVGTRYRFHADIAAAASAPASIDRVVAAEPPSHQEPATLALVILFVTGFSSMGMEVIWTRAFTPVLGTYVYSFAGLLFTYLWATWLGSWIYRRHAAQHAVLSTAKLLALLAITSLIPIVANDARFVWHRVAVALASIFPFCGVLGYLTPGVIDRYSRDDPQRAGKAYAINVIGCVLGPLFAGYWLLPALGARIGLVLLALPFVLLLARLWTSASLKHWRIVVATTTAALIVLSTAVVVSYEDAPPGIPAEVRRDHTATVISYGEGMHKQLLVNGIGITSQTPITKLMAHMPLAFHGHARSIAVICFGMGTTYRSALSWGVQTTAVDLARSVPDAFPYYFDDARALMKHPKGRIVIDDGRRFLYRTGDGFDAITIDPPPPVEAAGSSLLYSKEFYDVVKLRLNPDGLLQQWNPGGEPLIESAIARSLADSFTYVVAFRAVDGIGTHYTASMSPIRIPSTDEFLARLPDAAQRDLTEWNTRDDPDGRAVVAKVLDQPLHVTALFDGVNRNVAITDDRPFNEYYLLRRMVNNPSAAID